LPPAGTYKAETRQFLENLIGTTSNDVDLSNLLDENNRVTFVGGVAGIGKSVFANNWLISGQIMMFTEISNY